MTDIELRLSIQNLIYEHDALTFGEIWTLLDKSVDGKHLAAHLEDMVNEGLLLLDPAGRYWESKP